MYIDEKLYQILVNSSVNPSQKVEQVWRSLCIPQFNEKEYVVVANISCADSFMKNDGTKCKY